MEEKKLTFKDFNFKLAIIQELMYNQNLISPQFEVYDFIENYQNRKIDIDEEGYDPIPEVVTFFEELEIPAKFANSIEKIYMDGGNDIYMQICPYWDGEDDIFNITSAEDCHLFPNLKKVTLFYSDNKQILEDFKNKGVEAKWL